jgi:hypothetical protein
MEPGSLLRGVESCIEYWLHRKTFNVFAFFFPVVRLFVLLFSSNGTRLSVERHMENKLQRFAIGENCQWNLHMGLLRVKFTMK